MYIHVLRMKKVLYKQEHPTRQRHIHHIYRQFCGHPFIGFIKLWEQREENYLWNMLFLIHLLLGFVDTCLAAFHTRLISSNNDPELRTPFAIMA